MKGIYIVGGYPDRNKFKESFKTIADSGFDFIEVGIPFNDPTADGPVIAKAINETIDNGTQINDIIDDIILLSDVDIKKYVMTYSNIIYSYGIKKFSDKLKDYIDGIIIADLPNRMTKLFYDKGFDIPIVPFATLETRESDIDLIKESRSEFIYFVGIRGITGSNADFTSKELTDKIDMLKKQSDKKIIIGFGIKNSSDVDKALNIGDGFVVGTEAVKRQNDIKSFKNHITSLI